MSDEVPRPELVIAIDFGMTCTCAKFSVIRCIVDKILFRYGGCILQYSNWRRTTAMH